MRRLFLLVLLFWTFSLSAQELLMSGVNQGESLYIRNPYLADSGRFCVSDIYINGKKTKANLKLTAINVPFDGIQIFSPVVIRVKHDTLCKPRIVNPDAIVYHSSFKFDSVTVNDTLLHWYTKGDALGGKYEVEQLHNGLWNVVKEQPAKGKFNGARYAYFPEHYSGGNKYRVKYILPDGRYIYSFEQEVLYYPELITFSPKSVTEGITLSRAARYEILDSRGDVILQGQGKYIPLRLLRPGDYGIMIEGQEFAESFVKK
ncbi:hypothetical protein [Reichenbachiella versicolor]|uniref:hypothetical protein n=1 Tax=Reichenbachiella versicolor TaxID=1821036 RepID=UPI000D6E1068|nr:hypothetical protein [Reichenbachiella versicolor]